MKNVLRTLLRLTSSLLLLAFLYGIYWTFNAYDWNYPLHKLACFSALFAMVAGFQFVRSKRAAPAGSLWAEAGVLTVLFIAGFAFNAYKYGGSMYNRPFSDIGYTTIHAVQLVVKEGKNPYSRTDVTPRKDTDAGYHGFHYGPAFILGYMPSAWFPIMGYRIPNLLYFLASVALLILLIRRPEESPAQRLANIAFVLTAYILAERFWIEVLPEGANDLFHIMLILAGLLAFKHGRIFWAGLFIGLSCAGKFAPGMFLIPFMPLRDRKFWLGLIVGLTPYLPFLIWDPAGLWRNVFWLRVAIPADWTSLYWITPHQYHWIFGAITLCAFVTAVIWSGLRLREFNFVIVGFTLLLIVSDVVQKQVHGNHLIWFFPLFAILFMQFREQLYGVMTAPLEGTT